MEKWSLVRKESIYRTPVFKLCRQTSTHPILGRKQFFVLEAPSWVNIIPLTEKDEVVLIKQFRHGINSFTLEIPGGMVDPSDQDPAEAARREMLEETGYDAEEVLPLGKVHPNPAILDNLCFSFLALGVKKTGRKKLDHDEATRVVKYPLRRIKELIVRGRITHALVIAAFYLLEAQNPRDVVKSQKSIP